MLDWSGVSATCEVWGLFAHLVPQAALAQEDVRQQREVMRPDFRLELRNGDTCQLDTRLAELKFCCGQGLYKAGVRQRIFRRGVETRAEEVIKDYKERADQMDELLGEERAWSSQSPAGSVWGINSLCIWPLQ